MSAGANINAKMSDGGTALHIAALRSAAKFIKDDETAKLQMQRQFYLITKVLLAFPGLSIDAKNNTSGATPLFFAVDKGTEEVAKQLIAKGACVNIEVDGETIEEKLEEKMPDILSSGLILNRQDNDAIENKLFHLLYLAPQSSDKFIAAWEEAEHNNNLVNKNADNGMYTFLQYAADQGNEKLVDFLLEKNANPNLASKNYRIPPLVLAAHHGYWKVIQAFKSSYLNNDHSRINFAARDTIKNETVLHKILKGESKSSINAEFRDYDKCLDLLLEDRMKRAILPAVNATDQLGNTPLHLAAFLKNDDAIRKLLRFEANIGIKNLKMESAITFISPDLMEEFLDSCLLDYGLVSDEHFQLEFKYSFLGPPFNPIYNEVDDSNDALELNEDFDNENLKGHEVEKSYEDLPEAEPLWYMTQSPDHRALLAHPVITSFLCLKWRRIRMYYYSNLTMYLLFLACITAYLLSATKGTDNVGLRIVTLVCASALMLREAFQALVSPRRYFFNIENLLEVVMLAFTIYLTKSPFDVEEQLHRHLAAATILL